MRRGWPDGPLPSEEPDDEKIFTELVAMYETALGSQEELLAVHEGFVEMSLEYQKVDWSDDWCT